ncbi:MAG: NAD(P)H-dependent oxidoreductase subunit E [Verrucomicrobia bacterium]|nr:NAD(P)H-dependent oxidoreductase subunit E [Verrucomicrobiota bacterium]MCF7708463.1 NAD(P)H-dependent oxidoreductase subunit E [Verrucomicrobiota bacterium]
MSHRKYFKPAPELESEVDALVARYPSPRSAVVMVMHTVQEYFGCIPADALEWIARKLDIEPINVYELVTFYPMFHQAPVGKFHIKVCRTLSCALRGSWRLHEFLCDRLGLDSGVDGPQTTPDGMFTVEFVECLASCGTAPAMMCNDELYEEMDREKTSELIEQCKKKWLPNMDSNHD